MNKCSILVKHGKKRAVCRNKPVRWLQMGILGTLPDETTPFIHLCLFHAKKVYNWGFRE